MPRSRPDRTEEMRISLSNKEREFLAEQIKINQNKAWFAPIIGNFGTVVIGTGVVIGAYALWKWVGGFSPIETAKDAMEDFALWVGGGAYKVVAGESIKETVDRFLKQHSENVRRIETQCEERIAVPQAILADPNSSENQKAQATREVTQIRETCNKKLRAENQKIHLAIREMQDQVSVSSLIPDIPELPTFWTGGPAKK